jgi:arylsulfatase A
MPNASQCLMPLAFLLFLASCTSDTAPASAPTANEDPPNVLLIVVDDLGWADLNCYGNPLIQTVNIDALARNGVQFMQGYAAAPTGVASRAGLQSGLAPSRINKPETGLEARYETIGELAQRADYFTAHIGKWDLGADPLKQGYDRSFAAGNRQQPDSYYHPFFTDNAFPELAAATKTGDYLADALTDNALQLMDEWDGQPWLISLNFYGPHVPIEGRQDWVKHYKELLAETHYRKFPTVEYAAMVSTIDANIGRLIQELKAQGQLDNTLIIVTSDNGGLDVAAPDTLARHTPPTDNGILRSGKGSLYEGGIRVPFIVHYPAKTTETKASAHPVISTDIFPTLAELFGRNDYSPSPDGQSLLPLLQGKTPKERTLRWSHNGISAERTGDVKTIIKGDSTFRYNLLVGPGERVPLE